VRGADVVVLPEAFVLIGTHRKLVPTGSQRTVWGMGDGSTLETFPTPFGRVGGLICWENDMPLARFFLYSQGVEVWVAPTRATGDGWVATMRHIAREGRCFVIGVNPCLLVDQIPADFPDGSGSGARILTTPSGSSLATRSSSLPTESCWPGRRGTRRPGSSPSWTWDRVRAGRRCSTRSATTTGRTCSARRRHRAAAGRDAPAQRTPRLMRP
jgi:hypothetical protein